ncbi:hypothetical protein K435DRAFT_907115 [Dendrothele bispora CBS 962.96]|uniref:Uncharacterized protein n=1 Tax=Dendrothele bispora (strain CBS 962.96) TaxID=1314807 RepID=A0A4S8LRK0_DENBC|nr:hypothetical protein K435DRAFT_907115 [Dendrothele bispora CBS 962.96]
MERMTTDYEAPAMSVKSRAEIVLTCNMMKAELDLVKQHADRAHISFPKAVSKSMSPNTIGTTNGSKKSAKRPNVMREAVMLYVRPIVGLDLSIIGRLGNPVERIKASYAYSKGEYFGFCVAFRELCAIEAEGADGRGCCWYQAFG